MPDWKRIGLGLATGGLSEAARLVPSAMLFGEDPADVELPEGVSQARQRREQLMQMLEQRAAGEGSVVEQERKQALADLLAGTQSRVASATTGAGKLMAERGAQSAVARGGQQIASQAAAGRLAEQEQAERQLAALIGAEEKSAIEEMLLRQQLARPGMLAALLGGGGAAVGGAFGGAHGAQAGAELGSGIGRAGMAWGR